MKPAALVCGLFALGNLAVMVKNGFQPLFGYLVLVSIAASYAFYRSSETKPEPGDTTID